MLPTPTSYTWVAELCGGSYLTEEELQSTLADAYESALKQAALEAFEGRYEASEIAALVDRGLILDRAMQLISGTIPLG